MDQDDDYVIVTASDIAAHQNASDTAEMLEQPEPASRPRPHLEMCTMAYMETVHSKHDKWAISEAREEMPSVDTGSIPPYLASISWYLNAIADSLLWPMNKKIHDNPELNYKEFIAHKTLTSIMRSQPGWQVTPSAYGLATAWTAVYDSGREGPVVSFNAEMGKL